MSYLVQVKFSSPTRPDIILSDIINPKDWSGCNYWDEMGDTVSVLIGSADCKLSRVFPKGHDYTFSEISSICLEDVEE